MLKLCIKITVASLLAIFATQLAFEFAWWLPLADTERWLTAFHISAAAVALALCWALAAYKASLVSLAVLGLMVTLPTVYLAPL